MRLSSIAVSVLWLGWGCACSGHRPGPTNNNNNNNNNNVNGAYCGNGVVEAGEDCDDGVGNSDTLPNACRTTCVEASCGDMVSDALEQCDGSDLGGQTCVSVGAFDQGELSCTSTCQFDVSGCSACGNGIVDGSEDCDEGAANCADDPSCTCAPNCRTPGCGNGVLEAHLGEECDLGDENCDGPQCACSTLCAGAFDPCGFPEDGIWLEVDFTTAATVFEPTWRYSETPGWGEAQWVPTGYAAPFIHVPFDNVLMVDDVIGRMAYGAGQPDPGEFLVIFGLGGLLGYSSASVCIEGRSMTPGSPSNLNVFNGLNGCGVTTSIDPDPQVHAVGVNLTGCYVLGHGFQDVTLQPSEASDAMGIVRVRFTIHDPVF